MVYPEIPTTVKKMLRQVPVTVSDVVSWNSMDDLMRSHDEGDVIIVPNFIEGSSASLTFSKRKDYARVGVGEKKITLFDTIIEVWECAVYDAAMFLKLKYEQEPLNKPEVIEKATELINSLDWWEV